MLHSLSTIITILGNDMVSWGQFAAHSSNMHTGRAMPYCLRPDAFAFFLYQRMLLKFEFHYIHLDLSSANFPQKSGREVRYFVIVSFPPVQNNQWRHECYLTSNSVFIIFVPRSSKWATFHRLFISMTALVRVLIPFSVCSVLTTVCNGDLGGWYATLL